MKKIMILGGSENQLPLIKSSKKLGYYVIVVDSRNDAPGVLLADRHVPINYNDYDAIKHVAVENRIDGIITNSEPVVPIMTKVAEELNLMGNPMEGITTLMSKSKFRTLQQKIGLYCPQNMIVSSVEEIERGLNKFTYPIIIKPCECSGSRGSRKISYYNKDLISKSFQECQEYSRNNMVSVEEFVEMYSLTTIEGEIFVYGDKILWDGLFSTTRASYAPMVPMSYSMPLRLADDRMELIKDTVRRIIEETGIRFGEFNIEGYFTKSYEFFMVEINARQGGNHLPDFVFNNTGLDMTKLLVSLAVGDETYWDEVKECKFESKEGLRHVVFSDKDGTFKALDIKDNIKEYIVSSTMYARQGDKVNIVTNATDAVACIDMIFPESKTCDLFYDKIEDYISVELIED